MPAKPCISRHLRRFATTAGEKIGLADASSGLKSASDCRQRGTRSSLAVAGLVVIAAATLGSPSAATPPSESLVEVPRPDLTSFDTTIRRQIEEERNALDEALASSGSEEALELGARFGRLGQIYQVYSLDDPASACYANAVALSPKEFRWSYLAGVLALKRRDPDSARDLFRLALETRPNDLAVLLRLAETWLELDRADEAEPFFRRSLLVEETAAAHYGLGRIASEERSDLTAIEHFERALELQPAANRTHYHLARAYRRQGEIAAAREHLERTGPDVVTFPDPLVEELEKRVVGVGPVLERALRAFASRRYEEAVVAYREVLALEPQNATALSGLALSLRKTQDIHAATEAAIELLEKRPDDPRVRLEVAGMLLNQGKIEASIEHYRRAIELDPNLEAAYLKLGDAYSRKDAWDRAASNFEKALEINPGDPAACYALALAREKQGRRREGIELLLEIVREDPAHFLAHQQLGRLLAEDGDLDAAETEHEAVLEIDDAPPEEKAVAHYRLGRISMRQNRPADALAHDREAVRLSPELWQARFTIAKAMTARGRHSAAAAQLRQVVASDPELVPARVEEAEALMRAGRFADARSRLEEGLAELPHAAELAHLLARLLATAPTAELRDGARALDLASQIVEKFPALEHAETVVMALAELGRFEEAIPLQKRLVFRAKAGGSAELIARLHANLTRYQRGEKPHYP